MKDLQHEAAVYERLKAVQCVNVPVFLGTVDLQSVNKIYYYNHGVYIVHLTFLSWGGYKLDDLDNIKVTDKRLRDGALPSLQSMHRQGVVHRDMRVANMLFNPETNDIMIIDLERSSLRQPPRRALSQVVPKFEHGIISRTRKGKGVIESTANTGAAEDLVKTFQWQDRYSLSQKKVSNRLL